MFAVRLYAKVIGALVFVGSVSAHAREIRIPPVPIWYDHNMGWFKSYAEYKSASDSLQEQGFQDCLARAQGKISWSCGKWIIHGIKPNPLWPAINGQPYWNTFVDEEWFSQSQSSPTAPVVTTSTYGTWHSVFADTICPEGTSRGGETLGTISIGGQDFRNDIRWCSIVLSDPPDPSSCGKPDSRPQFGNPIDSGTGDKRQIELDYASGLLSLSRTYSSLRRSWLVSSGGATLADLAGRFADSNQETCIDRPVILRDFSPLYSGIRYRTESMCFPYFRTTGHENEVTIGRESGAAIQFTESTPSSFTTKSLGGEVLSLSSDSASSIPWQLRTSDNSIETYSRSGRLISRTRHDGKALTYGYDAGHTVSNSDRFGRQLSFAYAGGRLASAQLPDGRTINYQWASTGALDTVTYQDGSVRRYHYDEADNNGGSSSVVLLTGITDELGVRLSTYRYDNSGKGLSTEYAGGAEKYAFSYLTNTTTVTTPLNSKLLLYFRDDPEGNKQLSSANQPAGSGCVAASSSLGFDTAGNVISRNDFKGNRNCHKYDLTRNLETARVEGLSSASACPADAATYAIPTTLAADKPQIKVSTVWHPDWRLEAKRAEPKKLTTWVYNGQPDPSAGNAIASCAPGSALLPDGKPIAVLCKKIEQATTDTSGTLGFAATVTGSARTWTWTYNGYGQVLTENGPRTDVADTTTYTYYADTVFDAAGAGHTTGDLWKLTNAKGQVTETTLYDKHGHPLEIKDPNGMITRLTWHVRGWLTGKSVGPATGTRQHTTYDYDPAGQLKRVTHPDGSILAYTYDDAHRLTDIADGLGNTIHYALDAMGNRIKEEVKDPAGTLVRSQRRVYDALNRVQNRITPAQ